MVVLLEVNGPNPGGPNPSDRHVFNGKPQGVTLPANGENGLAGLFRFKVVHADDLCPFTKLDRYRGVGLVARTRLIIT